MVGFLSVIYFNRLRYLLVIRPQKVVVTGVGNCASVTLKAREVDLLK